MQRAKRTRDDFSRKDKLTLAKRVNFRCSLCDAQTVGPKTGTTDEEFSIGRAAHIKAAAPGGPRFDRDQSPQERASIENGLWACANCADIIDRDHNAYTVEQLHLCKSQAEQSARDRMGKHPESLLLARLPRSAIQRAVTAFCREEAAKREELDPRFKVSVHMSESGFVYEHWAKHPVAVRVAVGTPGKTDEICALDDFFNYGGSQVIEGPGVRLEGSPLFPSHDVSTLKLSTHPRLVTMTLEINDEANTPVFIELTGEATHGSKGLRFRGCAFGGLMRAVLIADFDGSNPDFSFTFHLDAWARKPVSRLPHFARLQHILQLLATSVQVGIRCAHDGIELDVGSGIVDGGKHFLPLRIFMNEVGALRKLDNFFSLDLMLPGDLSDVIRERGDISKLLAMIELEKSRERRVDVKLASIDSGDHLKAIIASQTPANIRISHNLTINVFGRAYGPFNIEVTCPATTVQSIGPAVIETAMPAQLAMFATEGHHWIVRNIGHTAT